MATAFSLCCSLWVQVASAIQINNEYWVSANPGTSTNGGTLVDPYDASTKANFDNLFVNILPTNCTVHLLPGVYLTAGYIVEGGLIKTGQKILGSGMDITTIRLASNTVDASSVIGSLAGSTGVEVCDLTIDCNYQGGSVTLHGISLFGDKCAIRRVKCINAASYSTHPPGGYECFPIGIFGTPVTGSTSTTGQIIEECEVSSYQGGTGQCSAITIGGNSTNIVNGGVIRNNRVIFPVATSVESTDAYNAVCVSGLIVEGNYCYGGFTGFYSDSGPYKDILISHNQFVNVQYGLFYHLGAIVDQTDGVSILFNTVEMHTNYIAGLSPVGITLWREQTNTVDLKNVSIIGNTVRFNTPPPANVTGYGVSFGWMTSCNVVGNMFDNGLLYSLNTVTNISLHDNVSTTGILATNGINQVALPNGWTRRTVTGNSSLLYSDYYVGVAPNSTTTVTNTLPLATGYSGKTIVIGDEAGFAGTHNIYTIPKSPDKINGAATPITISTAYAMKTFISDGTNWFAH